MTYHGSGVLGDLHSCTGCTKDGTLETLGTTAGRGNEPRRWRRQFTCVGAAGLFVAFIAAGCAHYPVNAPVTQVNPQGGYRVRNVAPVENSKELFFLLAFSGGGTRAAAFSYGVLEAFRDIEVRLDGNKQRLLDEVDGISGVSGGSFTAAYYGLFGDRIFEDFESRFLNKDIQGALVSQTLFNPINWPRLFSPFFARSDLAAEYYDKQVFEGATFADLAARKGPLIVINATDMVHGTRISFAQDFFDAICSDLSRFPVARACAASSAVPIVLTPITLRNHAGNCDYEIPEPVRRAMTARSGSTRQLDLANDLRPFLDSEKKPYIHLVDGGVADNLGLRAMLERVILAGDIWTTLRYSGQENVRKVVFVLVNAETEVDTKWDRWESVPPFGAMLASYSSIGIERYNVETVALLRESIKGWTEEVQKNRCGQGPLSTEPGACGDIQFYVVEVRFDALEDPGERTYFKRLPTSFRLSPEEVDKLRDAARRILSGSKEFQRLLRDLQ